MFAVPRLTPLVKALIIALVACFVLVAILDIWVLAPPLAPPAEGIFPGVFGWLALTPDPIGIHTIWQLVTYPFVTLPMPQVAMGFVIRLLFFWLFVSPFEERFGKRPVAILCAVGTIASGAGAIIMGQIFPDLVVMPLFGMSAWTLAALGAFATLYRQGTVSLLGLLPMKAWMFVVLAIVMAGFNLLTTRDLPNFAGDMAALAGGFGWARWTMRPRTPAKPRKKKNGRGFRVIQGGRDDDEEDDDDSGPRDRPRWLN